jgi:hypothetical protein
VPLFTDERWSVKWLSRRESRAMIESGLKKWHYEIGLMKRESSCGKRLSAGKLPMKQKRRHFCGKSCVA